MILVCPRFLRYTIGALYCVVGHLLCHGKKYCRYLTRRNGCSASRSYWTFLQLNTHGFTQKAVFT